MLVLSSFYSKVNFGLSVGTKTSSSLKKNDTSDSRDFKSFDISHHERHPDSV